MTPQSAPLRDAQSVQRQSQNLWLKALESLEGDLKAEFALENIPHADIPSILLMVVQDKKQVCLKKRWKYRKSNGEEVILRDVLENIAGWLEKFKAVGDSVIQYDPAHTALPWARVRFLLQVHCPKDDQAETLTLARSR